jgi:hypothetical protein
MMQSKVVRAMNKASRFYESLGLTISGMRNELSIGRNVIRVLKQPKYVCFRVNKSKNSIIIFPCEYADPMSYKVPGDVILHRHNNLRIYSKEFVQSLLAANQLDNDSTYTINGKYYLEKNLVRFDFCDAFENRMGISS